ncbi:MAG: serine hydrolase domain-containing protein [Ignavibacteriaceae bacterium]
MIDRIDSLLHQYNHPSSPGAGVFISYARKILLKQGLGYAEIEKDKKVSVSTNFRLASVTKQFTATAILQLIEKNRLSLETKLTEIFPEFPSYAKEISIYHLLSHTSGLIDYEDLIHDTVTVQVRDNDVLRLMLTTDSTYFEPGSKWRYSNTAYSLLALTVERISGLSFPDYLSKFIFQPLGMDNTIAFVQGINEVSERAYGYSKSGDTWIRTDQSVTSAVLGDGGIYSSINDLIKWENSLRDFSILDKKSVDLATTRKQLNDGTVVNYGFGWHIKNFNGREVIYHTGSTRGFRNIIYRIPELELVIILLTNRNEGEESSTENISDEITRTILESNQ